MGKPTAWTQFRTSQEFSLHIFTVVAETDISCTDAILQFCEAHGLEPQDISNKVDPQLKDRIAEEFRQINYLPKEPAVPC